MSAGDVAAALLLRPSVDALPVHASPIRPNRQADRRADSSCPGELVDATNQEEQGPQCKTCRIVTTLISTPRLTASSPSCASTHSILLGIGQDPELAPHRVGDSPINPITPLNAEFVLIVTFAQRDQAGAGVGAVIKLMLSYVLIRCATWTVLAAVWHGAGLLSGV